MQKVGSKNKSTISIEKEVKYLLCGPSNSHVPIIRPGHLTYNHLIRDCMVRLIETLGYLRVGLIETLFHFVNCTKIKQ